MKIYLTFILMISIVLSSYSQEKSEDLSYPDLIPIVENGLYGYCDKDKNIIIDPQFEGVAFFGEDLDFHDIKDPKKKIFGSSAYATVWQDGQRMRIDKKGKVVYRYNPDDFNEIRPKESMNASIKHSYEKFQDDQTLLWGVRDIATSEVLIPARYNIHEELYSYFHVPQYPLILVSSPQGGSKFYVGLNGTEYRESVAAQSKTEGYKIDYQVHLSGSDSATAKLRESVARWNKKGPYTSAYVTTEKIRVEDYSYTPWAQVVNVADGTRFRYWTEIDSTKTVRLEDATEPQLSFYPFSEEPPPFIDSMRVILTDDIQTIAGYTCSLARFYIATDAELLIWYVKDLPRLYFGKDDFLKEVPGLPLKITVHYKKHDIEFGLVATAVEKQKIDPSLFDLPEEPPISTDASDNAYLESLPYPDLIPVSEDGLVGYCDRDMNVIIEPQFYRADFFETDFSFQITNVNNPDIVRFGTDDYAWVVTRDEKRYRIDKKGNLVYHYNKADFKSDAPFISLDENDGFKVTGLDKTTLLQVMNDGLSIVDPAFYAITKIDTLPPKGTNSGLPDMLICCYLSRKSLPLSIFRDEKTQLAGLKHWDTEQIVIEPKYTMIDPLFNRNLKLAWYPLFYAFSPSEKTSFYVGLDGTEYIIRPKNEPEPK